MLITVRLVSELAGTKLILFTPVLSVVVPDVPFKLIPL